MSRSKRALLFAVGGFSACAEMYRQKRISIHGDVAMENLRFIAELLEKKKEESTGVYFIPEKWNYCGFTEFSRQEGREGEITLNPYAFFSRCLQSILEQGGTSGIAGAGTDRAGADGENLCRRTIYGMLVRAHSAWNHYENGEIISGSFLKSLCLLPLLQTLGVDIIYLLPVCDYSEEYKKGELGSPYAIKNFYKLDENLHDELLGEYSEELLSQEFKAFIEGCHLLGMKVILDFVFRTASRDNDLIIDHPDWFYWIDKEAAAGFHPPVVEKEKKLTTVQDRVLDNLYNSPGIDEYLSKFRPSPEQIDAGRWQKVKERQAQSGKNILTLVEEEFGITTVPGFSDIINDPQPPWTDVTYLRYYFDLHPKARQYVAEEEHPPFILQDGACLNLYQGEQLNKGLWDYIVGVIPFYQQEYGIDGARIDMGHALPATLIREILTKVRAGNPRFIFWSEEFSAENAGAAREGGFDFITGSLWHLYKYHRAAGFQRKFLRESWAAELPVAAAPETADTPRFAWRFGDKRLRELLILLNYFLPNTVPFINNGLELAEIQPMNLGLDNTEEGRFVLEATDPLYGKLAFFDRYCLHWLNPDRDWIEELLAKAARLRGRFIETLAVKENFLPEISCGVKERKLLFFCYRLRLPEDSPAEGEDRGRLFFLANKDLQDPVTVNFGELLTGGAGELEAGSLDAGTPDAGDPEASGKMPGETGKTDIKNIRVVYAGGEERDEEWPAGEARTLNPGEVVIGYTTA
ncbi:MAG: alpha amylase [Firmicutes bacterium]|nr:alpha amylase [Bacillota bacterium]